MENKFIKAEEVANELGVSKPYAYKLIRQLNEDLKEKGFPTKREAQEWERSFQMQTSVDMDMTFEAFVELYTKDMKPRLKENTWRTKENIIQTKILPYFGKKGISAITTKDVIAWQNELLAYRDDKNNSYSKTYLKTLHNQLSAIFNHAVRFYSLRANPAAKCDEMKVYLGMLQGVKTNDRIFNITKSYLHHEMDRGANKAGVKRIHIHGIRHLYVKHTTKLFGSS